jgi:arabinofuranan 3-O-arabinosyltransferase
MVLSSPGRVSADSKQALYLDPERFLAGAASLWDPSFGGGTVPHQHIGYLWPMGPWFWFFEQVGVPDWVAQRLWWGTLTLAAALGTRWLLRSLGVAPSAAVAGALVYALTPYQLAFTARMSVVLLPWAGLPWLVELTRRTLRHRGWRHPAVFALVVVTVAGVNATSLVLVGVGPLLVLLLAAARGWSEARVALGAGARLAVLSAGVSAWWLAGLRLQGAYGMPVLQLTENLSDIARRSMPGDVLRGLGNWFFAGQDRLGYSIDQAEPFLDDSRVIAASLVLPGLFLAALVVLTGRVRLLAVAFVVVATVVAVGSWPYEAPSAYGRAFRWFAEETSLGLALRNSHRIVPLLVLGGAIALAYAIGRLPGPGHRRLGALLVSAAALGAMAPVAATGVTSRHLDRPEELPAWWLDATGVLDQRGLDVVGNRSRVLEVPGAPFAAYRWGNTVEPVTPALLDRPYLAREVLPYGSAATANLLDAVDRRMQEGVFEPAALAPLARLFAAGDVVVRSDLQFERFRTPEPFALWTLLGDPPAPGVDQVTNFGPPLVNQPDRTLAPLAERDLVFGALVGASEPLVGGPVPPVAVLSVEDAPGVAQVRPVEGPIVLAGDGDGVVDAAAAGLIDGRGLVLYADSLGDDELNQVLTDGAHLVVTDSNRRRIQTWFYAIRDTRGPTERAGETLAEPTSYDVRVDVFPGQTDESRTVVQHLGGQVSATLGGGAARPEDRAMAAFDGDPLTAWRIGGPDPRGHRVSVVLDGPVELDRITLVQPQDGPRDRVVESVRLHFDAAPPVEVDLDDRSLDPSGQVVTFSTRPVSRFEVELTGVSDPGFDPALANAVGFAEIGLDGIDLAETVVLPPSLLQRVDARSLDHGLDLVLSRLRYDPYDRGRTDVERHLDRTFDLPVAREFGLSGTARIAPGAPDDELDELLGTTGPLRARASSRLAGDLTARAGSAIDGDPTTAWTTAFGPQVGQWIEIDLDRAMPLDELGLHVVVDEVHSIPSRVRVQVDGVEAADQHLSLSLDPAPPGTTQEVVIPLVGREGDRIRITIVEVERRGAPPDDVAAMATLPIAITDISVGGTGERRGSYEHIDTGCRDDLVVLDGEPLAIRISGPASAARAGLDVEACTDVTLGAGRHRLVAAAGHVSGIDLDRLVLSSATGGATTGRGARGASSGAGPTLVEVEPGRTTWTARVESDGSPAWIVLAESLNTGWTLRVDGRDEGRPTLVNGFANGWRVDPAGPGTLLVELSWTPQRLVSWAIALSALVVGVCIGLAVGSTPRPIDTYPDAVGSVAGPEGPAGRLRPTGLGLALGTTALGVALVSRPWIGVLAGLATAVATLLPRLLPLLAVAAPGALVASFALDRPMLAWLAVAIVVAATVGTETRLGWPSLRGRADAPRQPAPAPRGARPTDPET